MNRFKIEGFFPVTVEHAFFGRQGGVSTGLYNSLNCSPQSLDIPQAVVENRRRVVEAMQGVELSTLKQIHSAICHPVEGVCMRGIEEGDALVTTAAGQIIGCLTADCGPVLFCGEDGQQKPIIGAAHAGWGGALKGVLESTISAMMEKGAIKEEIKAAIGPCLAQENYEVGIDFQKPFIEEDPNAAQFFIPFGDKAKFDLQGYLEFRLKRAGIRNIAKANLDTYALERDYFSYRRTTHRGDPDYGRQISCIMIRRS